MSKKKSHKYTINVPCDILFCILIRLPVKSLLRFRSVSRPWKDVISDKKFKKTHSNQSKALGCVNFLLLKYCSSEFKLIIATETQWFPLKGFERAHVLCSHDGLVLLKKRRAYKTFVLWNPSTRQCLELASCPYLNSYTIPHASGLCYDPTTDDYKVILIYKPFYLIYSLRTFWTKKTTLPMLEQRLSSSLKQVTNNFWSSYICCQGITTEGCVYWSLDPELCPYVRRGSTIIYYDAKLEKLKELRAPIFVGDDNELFLLTTFKGRLCLYGGESTDLRSNETDLDMWIMEEDGWKLLMKLHYVPSTLCERALFC
ncbi:F-box protein CPR1-like [Lycium ferocissimum]|uniref:F-box protein CPR1-like n=1 Tax=Lycium ferocissimum TaxID=112874 RepID=UPI00281678CB|nr:F-box protein CPR1-like [Lycium ferocissimum]